MSKITLPVDISDLKLTPRKIVFIGEYCANDYNAEEAARIAKLVKPGMSQAEISVLCHELLSDPDISKAISRFVDSTLAPYRDKFENVRLRELYIRAFYKPSWYHRPDGTVIPLDKISLERQSAIDKVEEKFYGKDGIRTVTYTLANKDIARRELKEMLKKGEEGPVTDDMMRTRLKEIFAAAKTGIQIGAQMAKELKDPTDAQVKLLDRIKEGKEDAETVN
jgi:hypothetical protein